MSPVLLLSPGGKGIPNNGFPVFWVKRGACVTYNTTCGPRQDCAQTREPMHSELDSSFLGGKKVILLKVYQTTVALHELAARV
jgi:hypothetical protein